MEYNHYKKNKGPDEEKSAYPDSDEEYGDIVYEDKLLPPINITKKELIQLIEFLKTQTPSALKRKALIDAKDKDIAGVECWNMRWEDHRETERLNNLIKKNTKPKDYHTCQVNNKYGSKYIINS
jgi:predicted metal-dependent phosphoesterase TrpH